MENRPAAGSSRREAGKENSPGPQAWWWQLDQKDGCRAVVVLWISTAPATACVEETELKEMSGTKPDTPNVV